MSAVMKILLTNSQHLAYFPKINSSESKAVFVPSVLDSFCLHTCIWNVLRFLSE